MKLAMHLIPSILCITFFTSIPTALAKGIHREENFVHPFSTPKALTKGGYDKRTTETSFVHPGILSTQEDLDRMKYGVGNKTDPWYSAFLNLSGDPLASSSYTLRGPLTIVTRNNTGASPGTKELSHDAVASLLNALMYYITGKAAYAEKSVQIFNDWSNTLELINGTDAQLVAALAGVQLVNAAEIIRYTYSGWADSDISTFEDMILNIFYPPASQTTPTAVQPYPFQANWGTSGEKAIVAFGVFLNNMTMYEQGLTLYTTFSCADLNNTINSFGQNSESGRDQAHTQLSLGNMAEICQTAYNQGDDTYWDLLSERLMIGFEYTAEYNLGNEVDYNPGFYRCGANHLGGPWHNISAVDRGQFRPIYQLPYSYYVQVQGLEMPWTEQVIEQIPIEANDGFNNMGDSASYGTLRFSRVAGDAWAAKK